MGRADILLNMLLSPTSPIIFKRASIKYELLLMQNSTAQFLVLKSLTKEEPNARHGGRRAKASFDYELMSKVQHPKCKKQKEK